MADLVRFLSLGVVFFTIVGLLIASGVARGCSRRDSEAAISMEIRDVPPAFDLTASQLAQAYRANEEASAAAYNAQVGIVEGPSFLVEESNYLRFYVDKVWAVRCFLSEEQMDRISALASSRNRVFPGCGDGTFEARGIGSGWPIAFTPLPVFALKGKVEGVNNKHLTVDLRGCIIQDFP